MDTLIKDCHVLLEKDGDWTVTGSQVGISGDTIKHVGLLPEGYTADQVIDGRNKLLIPGLINAHNHSYMTLFRNYADDLPFQTWLFDKIMPLEDQLTGEDCYWGSQLAIMEMLRTGTTCFFDMYMFIQETSRAVDESGIRACLSRGLVGADKDPGGERRLNEACREMDYWQNLSHPRMSFMLSAHAPYTCDPEFLRRVVAEARRREAGLCVHLAESQTEVETIQNQYGCTPTEYMERTGFFEGQALAAHCLYLTEKDLDILASRRVHVVTNPVSNMKLANGFAPLGKMMEKGINICLGTDSAASNNTQNLFKDLQCAALIHKGHDKDAERISAGDALRFATVNGARALGLEGVTGQIQPGMKADLVLIDMGQPQFYPRNNLVSALAYSTSGQEVVMSMVDGKILYDDGEYTTIDQEQVFHQVSRTIRRLAS